jgi:prostamide/prostaglandin F2alpha synthase
VQEYRGPMSSESNARDRTDTAEHAEGLAEIVLDDVDGGQVRLGDLWADRPAVLVFLRHYG